MFTCTYQLKRGGGGRETSICQPEALHIAVLIGAEFPMEPDPKGIFHWHFLLLFTFPKSWPNPASDVPLGHGDVLVCVHVFHERCRSLPVLQP